MFIKFLKGTHNRALNDCKQMVSGSISLRSPRFFSPFPHGTCSLSIWQEYLGLESGLPSFRQDFTCPALLRILLGRNCFSHTGLSPSPVDVPCLFCYPVFAFPRSLPRTYFYLRFGLLRFRSPLLTQSLLISFPKGTKMFQFPSFAPLW